MTTKIGFVSLGCDKNTVDSQIMVQLLADHGYEIVKNDEEAEVIIVNTCGFIQDAKEESINTLIELGELKETANLKYLIAAGCLAQRYSEEIRSELPEVDAIIGCGSPEKVVEAVEEMLAQKDEYVVKMDPVGERDLGYHKQVVLTPGYYGYVKIAEGCDNRCTYCAIPALRGPYRSRQQEDILQEVRDMAEQGVRELMVIAQDITKYGRDLDGKDHISALLKEIAKVEGIDWIRLLYCYPEDITDELIETMASEPKIVHYVDMPIQHCSNTVLRRMGRRHTKEKLVEVIRKLREKMPDVAIRTTLITGFPGETEEEYAEMAAFIREIRFDRLGVFAYSQEEGTPAGIMKDQVPDELKQIRKDQLMAIQQEISMEKSAELVGRELTVMIEGLIPEEELQDLNDDDALESAETEDEELDLLSDEPVYSKQYVYSARTWRDAPDIDGFLFLTSSVPYNSGDFVKARVTGSYEYDLTGIDISQEVTE